MKVLQSKGSVLIYVLMLVNIALIMWVLVFNNIFVLTNHIDVWANSEEVYSEIYDKWHIALQSIKKYNWNWNWNLDALSCPTNITMSGSTSSGTNISTVMTYAAGSIFCKWTYNSKELRIYFDSLINSFESAYYDGDLVNIQQTEYTDVWLKWTKSALDVVSSSLEYFSYTKEKAIDGNDSTWFESLFAWFYEWITFDFSSGWEKSIWKIILKKNSRSWLSLYWDYWDIVFRDSWGFEVERIGLSWMDGETYKEIDLKTRGLLNDTATITLETYFSYLDVLEFEVYELESIWSEEIWEWDRDFTDSDSTYLSFVSDGIMWEDWLDDDFNNDDYKVTWGSGVYYPDGFQDDDVIPRKTFYWSIPVWEDQYNIFWNNYKTNAFSSGNINNNDTLNVKIWDTSTGYVILDTYNKTNNLYNLKILEFDRDAYQNQFTLLPLASYSVEGLADYRWYIQKSSSWVLSISKDKTWNEYVFDFKNNDYWIFVSNTSTWTMSYRVEAETETWTWIYINPIDDSWITIKAMANHIIIGPERNFIWDNFTVVGNK